MIPTYSDYFKTVMRGNTAQPRGRVVREVYNATLIFRAGEMLGRRNVNHNIGLMEGFQFIAGVFEKDLIAAVAPNARLDLFTLQAAYGPRALHQFPAVIEALRADSMTRQAAVTLPNEEEAGSAQMPCTITMVFRLRNNRLASTVFMRSSDAVWGLPYDVTQFGMALQVVARVLNVTPVSVTLFIANGHIYDGTQHLEPDNRGSSFNVTASLATWVEAQAWARTNAQNLADGRNLEGIILT